MGTSCDSKGSINFSRDHPHAYGDKFFLFGQKLHALGSSPRVWGQAPLIKNAPRKPRIIPTRMGTRSVNGYLTALTQDHPHAYGDKNYNSFNPICQAGSSPRVWGQVCYGTRCQATCRIIPTRMGTSHKGFRPCVVLRDHPHAYGDKPAAVGETVAETGSSPRVWGQGNSVKQVVLLARIIPTRMGTSQRQ